MATQKTTTAKKKTVAKKTTRKTATKKTTPKTKRRDARKTAAKKKATAKKKTTKTAAAKNNGTTTALALVPTGSREMTKTEVNTEVAEGKCLYREHMKTGYDFAIWLERAHNMDLWKRDGYDTWDKFVEERVGCSRGFAHVLIRCKQLYTREQFEALGTGRMKLMLKIPAAKRDELLETIEAQKLSVRQTHEEVQRIKETLPNETTVYHNSKKGKLVTRKYSGPIGRPRTKLDVSELVGKTFTHTFPDGEGLKEFLLHIPAWKISITLAKLKKGDTVAVEFLPVTAEE